MKCLVVTAHPVTDSLCHTLAKATIAALKEAGHEVEIEDLYASGFSPSLTTAERQSYYGSSFDSSAVQLQIDRLLCVEALVLVFPTWWFGFPAILRGWFDRVWAPGIAYDHANESLALIVSNGRLRSLHSARRGGWIVSSCGNPSNGY